MDAFDGSDQDDSQATEMLQELLQHASSPIKPNESRSSVLKNQFAQSHEISSDSLPSSRTSHSMPQYHFHGLASTQTQSQSQHPAAVLEEEEEPPNESSQKENIGAAPVGKEVGRSIPSAAVRSTSPHASSSKNVALNKALPAGSAAANEKATNKKVNNVTFQSPRPRTRASVSPVKPVTRQSPHKPTAPSTRYKPVSRPRSSSQDSFAHDPDNNKLNEERFIAKAEQFALPLSELGKDSSPIRDPSDATGGTSSSSMMGYPGSGRQPIVSSPLRGRILVEATPSQSSGSPSQGDHISISQRMDETQLFENSESQLGLDAPLDKDVSGSGYESSEPSSSVARFYHEGAKENPVVMPAAQETQPSTQPSTQPEDIPGLDPPNHFRDIQSILSMPVTTSTNPSGPGPRSLLSTVRPENRHRYREYRNTANIAPPPPPAQASSRFEYSNAPSVIPSLGPETQPSFPEAPAPRRGFPPRTSVTASVQPVQTLPSPASAAADSMDIVPDSEPLRTAKEYTTNKKPVAGPSRPSRNPNALSKMAIDENVVTEPVGAALEAVPEEMEEEEEEEEEEDIPLAAAPAKRPRGRPPGKKNVTTKGKEKATPAKKAVPPTPKTTAAKGKGPASSATKPPVRKPAMAAPTTYANRSWETGVVPSSVPEQDLRAATRPVIPVPPKRAPQKAPQKAPQSRQSTRSTSGAPRSHLKQEMDAEISEDDEPLMKRGDNDNDTELADEEYQDEADGDGGHTGKRKRAAGKPGPAAQGARGAASKRAKHTSPAPRTTQAKTLRSAASTTAQSIGPQGSRVFALWSQDGHYYPGIVHSTDSNSRYHIKFDDATESWISIQEMRLCELHVGDDVLFGNRPRPAKVVNVDSEKEGYVKVNADGKVQEIAISELKIANKTILYGWTDRTLTPATVTTTVKPVRKHLSPSPSKLSMVSVPTVRGNRKKVLANTGLIITLSAANGNWEKEKESVMNAVKNSGGFVIDDLNTVIKMEGKHASQNNRWTIKKTDVQWIGNDNIERLFLLADDPNQKPKFLMALALGIPCLTTSWLHDSVESGEEKDWFGYMLPQGYSAVLQARPSQQVDVDWGNSNYQLRDIMGNSVACKIFAKQTILCVGPDMVGQPKSRGKRKAGSDDKTQDTSNAVPRIILAMGADVVEAVTEARYASKALPEYDLLVIREPSQYLPEYRDCTAVHWSWVKECLIASRRVSYPTWQTEEHSQEA